MPKQDDGLRPDSIAHSDRKRETFQERYDAARWRRHLEQEASGLEVSISMRDSYRNGLDAHPAWAVRRAEEGMGP